MLVFATSDKGGTGRSVTSCNIAYQAALQARNTAYVDFDFGSPTAGTIFSLDDVSRGTTEGGVHSLLRGEVIEPHRLDVWHEAERSSIRSRPDGAGDLVLYPGDSGGGEFVSTPDTVQRCLDFFGRLESEFDLSIIDLSAGRSYATEIVLEVLARPEMANVTSRWLIFHRWTRQHIVAANGLVNGENGIIAAGVGMGHDTDRLTASIRFVRTAFVDPDGEALRGLAAAQIAWLHQCNNDLHRMAGDLRVGRTRMIGEVPLDPMLQWREQILTSTDTRVRKVANLATVEAFATLARDLFRDEAWTLQ